MQTLYLYKDNSHHYSTQNILQDSMHHNVRHTSNLPKFNVPVFQFHVLQSVSHFYSTYLKKVLRKLSSCSQTCITSNKHTVHSTSEFYLLCKMTGSDQQQLSQKMKSLQNSFIYSLNMKTWWFRGKVFIFFLWQVKNTSLPLSLGTDVITVLTNAIS